MSPEPKYITIYVVTSVDTAIEDRFNLSVVSNSYDPMEGSLPGSSVHGISQGRILEWVAMSFSMGSSQSRDQSRVSCIVGRFFTDLATREVLLTLKLFLN